MPGNVLTIRSLGSSRCKIKLKNQDLSNCSIYKRWKKQGCKDKRNRRRRCNEHPLYNESRPEWVRIKPSPAAGGKAVDLAHSALPTILYRVLVPLASILRPVLTILSSGSPHALCSPISTLIKIRMYKVAACPWHAPSGEGAYRLRTIALPLGCFLLPVCVCPCNLKRERPSRPHERGWAQVRWTSEPSSPRCQTWVKPSWTLQSPSACKCVAIPVHTT